MKKLFASRSSRKLPNIGNKHKRGGPSAFQKFSTRGKKRGRQGREGDDRGNKKTKNILKALTADIVKTYRTCNPHFCYVSSFNPRRVLTKDCEPSRKNPFDNRKGDLILRVGDVFVSNGKTSYIVMDLLGKGTFGQVVKCSIAGEKNGDDKVVAVKVVKNKPAYHNQAKVEIKLLTMLNDAENDGGDRSKSRIAWLKNHFEFRNHLCLVFELLNINLYEILKKNRFRGLKSDVLISFTKQIVEALEVLANMNIVHCDLKPENIMLMDSDSLRIKLIDFGSSCFENRTVYTYIQSRFYRAPEIILGLPYKSAIDIWSLGCIVVEMFIGLPIFPGVSEHNQLMRMSEMLGKLPRDILDSGKNTGKFYLPRDGGWSLKTPTEWARDKHLAKPEKFKRYIRKCTLTELAMTRDDRCSKFSHVKGLEPGSKMKKREEKNWRRCFLNFTEGLLTYTPEDRWTAWQCTTHPFLSGTPYTGPHTPPPDPKLSRTKAISIGHPRTGSGNINMARTPPSTNVAAFSQVTPPNRPTHPMPFGATPASHTEGSLHQYMQQKPNQFNFMATGNHSGMPPAINTMGGDGASMGQNVGANAASQWSPRNGNVGAGFTGTSYHMQASALAMHMNVHNSNQRAQYNHYGSCPPNAGNFPAALMASHIMSAAPYQSQAGPSGQYATLNQAVQPPAPPPKKDQIKKEPDQEFDEDDQNTDNEDEPPSSSLAAWDPFYNEGDLV